MATGAIEQIKQRLDIVKEIGAVVALRPSGKAYKGLCPFHQERTPSFYVFPETGSWRCFGCNKGGDLFTFVAEQQRLDFRDVLGQLAEKAGVPLGTSDDEFHAPSAESQTRARLRQMNDASAIWFNHQLLASATATHARSYLQGRGIANETIETFRLGYAPEGDGLTRYLLTQGFTAAEIVAAGLARQRDQGGDLYDYFRQRIIFTIRDSRGQTIGFGGRELGGGHPKYLNTPQTPLFDKSATLYGLDLARDAIKRNDQAVIVEGYVDAVIAHQYGFHNTVACIGSAITPKHVQQIKKLTRRLVLALDPDAAGEAATLRAIEVAQQGFDRVLVPAEVSLPTSPPEPGKRKSRRAEPPQGMIRFAEQVDAEISILRLPDGVDPDEFIRQQPKAWAEALHHTQPLMEFYFDTQLAGLDLHQPDGKAEAARRLLPLVAQIGDRIRQDTYVRQLASLLRIPERDVQMELRRHRQSLPKPSEERPEEGSEGSENIDRPGSAEKPIGDSAHSPRTSVPGAMPGSPALGQRHQLGHHLEEYCIGLLVHTPAVIQEICAILGPTDFRGTETRLIFSLFASMARQTTQVPNGIMVDDLLATLPDLVNAEAQRIRAEVAAQPALDRISLARTAKQLATRLKCLRLSEAITELSYVQREAEERGDRETERLLRVQGLRLHQELGMRKSQGLLQSS